jgi:tetratricopeptide (TPR) repeat protein
VYRKGRIYDAMGKQTEAIASYKETIKLGEKEPMYFAANAALNLGFIYEKVHDKTQARYYYNLCINLKDHEYYSGLSQKAKSGLERLD